MNSAPGSHTGGNDGIHGAALWDNIFQAVPSPAQPLPGCGGMQIPPLFSFSEKLNLKATVYQLPQVVIQVSVVDGYILISVCARTVRFYLFR